MWQEGSGYQELQADLGVIAHTRTSYLCRSVRGLHGKAALYSDSRCVQSVVAFVLLFSAIEQF